MAILVTVVAGEALDKIKDISDEDLVDQCMGALKNMFPEQVSVNFKIVLKMSYSFVRIHVCCNLGCPSTSSMESYSVVEKTLFNDVIFLRSPGSKWRSL